MEPLVRLDANNGDVKSSSATIEHEADDCCKGAKSGLIPREKETEPSSSESKQAKVGSSIKDSAAARARELVGSMQGGLRRVGEHLHLRPHATLAVDSPRAASKTSSTLQRHPTSQPAGSGVDALKFYEPRPDLKDPVLEKNLEESAAWRSPGVQKPTQAEAKPGAGKGQEQGAEALRDRLDLDGSQAEGYYGVQSAEGKAKFAEVNSQLDLYSPPQEAVKYHGTPGPHAVGNGSLGWESERGEVGDGEERRADGVGRPRRNLGGAEVDPKMLLEGEGTRSRL